MFEYKPLLLFSLFIFILKRSHRGLSQIFAVNTEIIAHSKCRAGLFDTRDAVFVSIATAFGSCERSPWIQGS